MSLETKSIELKEIVGSFETKWFLGHISGLIMNIVSGLADTEIKNLSSPLKQLYYLGGLLLSSNEDNISIYSMNNSDYEDIWNKIVILLNEIEEEYEKMFIPKEEDIINEDWLKMRSVAMPSFLKYFNQGPLNYEEQKINWISDLYKDFDDKILKELNLTTSDLILFYNTIDFLFQDKFQGFTGDQSKFKKEWMELTDNKVIISKEIPDFFRVQQEEKLPLYQYVQDNGIICRFRKEDLVNNELSIEKIGIILDLFTCNRLETEFLFYSSTKPSNPLYKKPIVIVEQNLFQIFEVKQVLHSIEELLENICLSDAKSKTKLIDKKGKLLENRISHLFEKMLVKNFEKFDSYYVDGNEQDLLFLWKKNAFIIEAKGYSIREPLRDPSRAYERIKDDFKNSIGYGYKQTHRIESKFINNEDLIITDEKKKIIKTIKTSDYDESDFSIIVNLNSFGQIQNDLSTLLKKDEEGTFPWVVKLDDLEVIILTLLKLKKTANYLIEYLTFREQLHGRLICSDELEIFGAFIQNIVDEKMIEDENLTIMTHPNYASLFDDLYYKGFGFKNEKYLKEKLSGKYRFI